ncbi:hypothetical protein ABK040_010319 [Willaertia magna]
MNEVDHEGLLFDQVLRDPKIRRRMALGNHFQELSLSEEEEKKIKEEIIQAKKYEIAINEKVTKKIENEELQKLLLEHDDTVASNAKMNAYKNKLLQLQLQTESKLKKQVKQAEEFENSKLQQHQQKLIESETKKLLEGRSLFQQYEEKRNKNYEMECEKRDQSKDEEKKNEDKIVQKKTDLVSLLQSPKLKQIILVMTVDIGDGRVDTITVREDDSYLELTKQFQEKHNLISGIVEPLAEQIKLNVEKVLREQKQGNSGIGISNNSTQQQESFGLYNKSGFNSNNSSPARKILEKGITQQIEPLRRTEKSTKRSQSSQSKKSVYDRLHEAAKHKEARLLRMKSEAKKYEGSKLNDSRVAISETSKRIMEELERTRLTKGKFNNYGEYLYKEGLAHSKKQQIELEKKKKQEEEELNRFTFTPQINNTYKVTNLKNIYTPTSYIKPITVAHLSEDEKELTFKPKLTKKSLEIVKSRKEFTKEDCQEEVVHEALFKDAEKRRAKMDQQRSVSPTVSQKGPTKTPKEFEDFLNRLAYSKKASEKYLDQLRTQLRSNIDPLTGRELFKPQIIKRPKSAGAKLNNHDYTNIAQDIDHRKEVMKEEYYNELKKMANTKHTSENSAKIAELTKLKRIRQLFDYLDSDHDGYLSIKEDVFEANENRFNILDKQLQNDLLNVFEQFDLDGLIGFDDFAHSLIQQLEKYKFKGAKSTLLTSIRDSITKISNEAYKPFSYRDNPNDCTFHPNTNKKSDAMIKNLRKSLSGNLHEALYNDKETREKQMQILKKNFLEEEMKECSFKPKLSKNIEVEGSTFARLTAPKKKTNVLSSVEIELQECSFKPKINEYTDSNVLRGSDANASKKLNRSYSEIYSPGRKTPNRSSSRSEKRTGLSLLR